MKKLDSSLPKYQNAKKIFARSFNVAFTRPANNRLGLQSEHLNHTQSSFDINLNSQRSGNFTFPSSDEEKVRGMVGTHSITIC